MCVLARVHRHVVAQAARGARVSLAAPLDRHPSLSREERAIRKEFEPRDRDLSATIGTSRAMQKTEGNREKEGGIVVL